jgi:hypothetical protein
MKPTLRHAAETLGLRVPDGGGLDGVGFVMTIAHTTRS